MGTDFLPQPGLVSSAGAGGQFARYTQSRVVAVFCCGKTVLQGRNNGPWACYEERKHAPEYLVEEHNHTDFHTHSRIPGLIFAVLIIFAFNKAIRRSCKVRGSRRVVCRLHPPSPGAYLCTPFNARVGCGQEQSATDIADSPLRLFLHCRGDQ
jgi:hypothetical protein